jgi:hypothetical protein
MQLSVNHSGSDDWGRTDRSTSMIEPLQESQYHWVSEGAHGIFEIEGTEIDPFPMK